MWLWVAACTATTGTTPWPEVVPSTTTPPRPPDLVYVTWDTTRRDHVRPWGGDPVLTPNLQRLADGALVFEDVQAGASWTKPSMATTLTSRPAAEHGVWDWEDAIDPATPTLFTSLRDGGYRMDAVVANNALEPEQAPYFLAFDVYDVSSFQGIGFPGDLVTSQVVTDQALGWLDELESDEESEAPFLLWVHYFDPHQTYFDHDDVVDLGDDQGARYAEEVAYTDGQFGRLLDRILDRPNTLIVYHADHGEELGDHGRYGHAFSLYQEQLAVPLLLRGPGVEPGTVSAPVSLIDLAPTVLDLLDLPVPDSFRGLPLLPEPVVRPLIAETRRFADLRSIRDGDEVLIWDEVTATSRLYDLSTDPGQTVDLAAERSDERARLQSALAEIYPEIPAL